MTPKQLTILEEMYKIYHPYDREVNKLTKDEFIVMMIKKLDLNKEAHFQTK